MYIPTTILKTGNFSKAADQATKTIFGDKIVSARTSPLLYNIEYARRKMASVMNNTNPGIKVTTADKVTADRGYLARDMLLMSNVSYVLQEKKFSLLRAQSNKGDLKNKNMTDQQQFDETFNSTTTAEDKYKYTQDPFYKADEGQVSNQVYEQEVDQYDQIAVPPDLSTIASGLAVKNLRKTGGRQTKYFTNNSSPGGND